MSTPNETLWEDTCQSLFRDIHEAAIIPLGIVNVFISVISGIGNSSIAFVILRQRSMRSKSNIFLCSLAIADLFSGAVLGTITYIELFWSSLRSNCGLDSARRFITGFILCWTLSNFVAVGYDRYVHMKTLQNYSNVMTWKKVYTIIAISWSVPIIIPPLRFIDDDENTYNIFLIVYLLLYSCALVYFYVLLLYYIGSKRRIAPIDLRNRTLGHRKSTKFNIDRLVAGKTVIVIISLFFVATVPATVYFALLVMERVAKEETPVFFPEAKHTLYAFAMTTAIGHSAVDPITFYVRHRDIRRQVNLHIVSHITFNIMWVANNANFQNESTHHATMGIIRREEQNRSDPTVSTRNVAKIETPVVISNYNSSNSIFDSNCNPVQVINPNVTIIAGNGLINYPIPSDLS